MSLEGELKSLPSYVEKVCDLPRRCPAHRPTVWTGTAIFCLLSQHMTVVLQRLEVPVPRKLAANSSVHEKVCRIGLHSHCLG